MDIGAPPLLLPTSSWEVGISEPVIVGTESHAFVGSESSGPGTRCKGLLGNMEGSFCGALRCESIHEDHSNWCVVCDGKIKVMSFRGTGVCSEIHRKQRDGVPVGYKYGTTAK